MSRHLAWLLILLVLSCAPYETVGTRTYFGFSIGIENAPPPPRVIVVDEPSLVAVPGTSVYVIENSDYDVFRYGTYFYVASGGYWYRASDYNGPYMTCDVRSIPRAVLTVPPERWKHRPPRMEGRHEGWRS
ncbi:MAG: hypothetical protein HYR74_02400 [Candidatus Eisenbacteria bacterium]|nr:hypothetical protein [Candidatus Eisenbacteria bacterium]